MMNEQRMERRLYWEDCFNARDLGGYPTAEGGRTRWGACVRADNLRRLTPAGQAAVVEYGVRTVIDLRRAAELTIDPNPFAAAAGGAAYPAYHNLPMGHGASDAARAAVAAAGMHGSMLDLFRLVLDHYGRGVGRVVTTIAGAPAGGVLFHCHAGKDRTGLIAALLLALAGVPEPIIVEDYVLSKTLLQTSIDRRVAQEPDPQRRALLAQTITAHPETMHGILQHLNTHHGGAELYLLAAGVAPGDIERVRRRIKE